MDRINSHQLINISKHRKLFSEFNFNSRSTNRLTKNTSTNKFEIPNPKIKGNSTSHSFKNWNILETDSNITEIEKYQKNNQGLMSEYRFESEPNLLTKFGNFAQADEMKNIKSFFNNSLKINSKTFLGKISKENNININVPTEDYKSILDAVLVLKNNKEIHNNLVKNFICRQNYKYLETYQEINNSQNILMSNKVRITKGGGSTSKFAHSNIIDCDDKLQIKTSNKTKNSKSNKTVTMSAFYQYPSKNFPECRDQFSFSTDYYSQDFIIFGGNSTKVFNDLWIFDPKNLTFKKVVYENMSPIPRYGHTAIIYQKKLIIFGGKVKMHNFTYLADLEQFSLEDKTWSVPHGYSSVNNRQRKNQIAELVGHQIFFNGGYNELGEISGESFLLNLNPVKWVKMVIAENKQTPSLAHHTSCIVLPKEIKFNSKLNIYKFPEISLARRSKIYTKEKGIFIFGGKKPDGSLSNEMWCLRIGRKPCEWIKCESKGQEPIARSHHSMNYYEEGNYIIIYGGTKEYSSSSILNEIYLFELSKFEWIYVKISFSGSALSVENRCGHGGVISNNKLILFGGMNDKNYIGSALFIISLGSVVKEEIEIKSENDVTNSRKSVSFERQKFLLPKLNK